MYTCARVFLYFYFMSKDKSIDLFEIKKNTDESINLDNMIGGNYKHEWYTKNTNKVKNYNKEYYEKHKNEIKNRKKNIEK